MRLFLLTVIFLQFAACASGPWPISSPLYLIPGGSKLIVKQSLTIPAGKGRVYLQGGKQISEKEKDQYYAHCWFLSRKVLQTPQTIQPDTFIVTHSSKLEEEVQLKSRYQLASLSSGIYASNGATATEYITELDIHSDKQADIFRFACSHWEDPTDAQHLTVKDMKQVLGDMVIIELKRE